MNQKDKKSEPDFPPGLQKLIDLQNLQDGIKPSTRKVVTRAPARTVRLIHLPPILPHPVEAESSLEADYVRRAAFAPTTVGIIHQPFQLPISRRGYTPDFLQVQRQGEKTIIEVKLRKKIKQYADLFDRAADFLGPKGFRLFVLSESDIHKNKAHERALLLRRYLKAYFPLDDRNRARTILTNYPKGLPLATLARKARVSRELLICLVAQRVLTTGPNLQVDDSAVIQVPQTNAQGDPYSIERWFGVAPWGASAK